MQWILISIGLVILFLLALRPVSRASSPAEDQQLEFSISSAAETAHGQGKKRIFVPHSLLTDLEKNIRWLNGLPADELIPAAQRLCENGRFLQEETAALLMQSRRLPAFPRSLSGETRMQRFASVFWQLQKFSATKQSLQQAVSEWQSLLPMTCSELDHLSFFLRLELLFALKKFSLRCVQDQQALHAAHKVHTLIQNGKEQACQKIYRFYQHNDSFWECLFSLEGDTISAPEEQDLIISREHEHQEMLCLWIGNIITSLQMLQKLPWLQLTEESSLIHNAFASDNVYLSMDEESRAYYRFRLSRMAEWMRLPEQTVCTCVLSLCKEFPVDHLKAHIGYYLLDQGQADLISRMHAPCFPARFFLFLKKHFFVVFRTASWFLFFVFLFVAFRENLPMVLLVPFAALFLHCTQQLSLRLFQKLASSQMIPRILLHNLHEENQTLVVCPVVLRSAEHAIAMVKRMSIMHEANPDQHLHFLLLGDFQDCLTATAPEDALILSAASAAVEALKQDTGHSFDYIQRERVFVPGETAHHGRERTHGSVDTLLRLIEGYPIDDHFAFSTIDPASLVHKYRYVITLDAETLLPPGSVYRMVGEMLHPLQKHQKADGGYRGASMIQPRIETAAHTVKTYFGRLTGSFSETICHSSVPDQNLHVLLNRGTFTGTGIIDPASFLQETDGSIASGMLYEHGLLDGELSGCIFSRNTILYQSQPQTLIECLYRSHRQVSQSWLMLLYVLPLMFAQNRPIKNALDSISKWKIWRGILESLLPLLRLFLLVYALYRGNGWLFTAAVLIPELPRLTLSVDGLFSMVLRLAILPCEAVAHADAICRTLWRLFISHRNLLSFTSAAQLVQNRIKPSIQLFYTNMACAVVFALLSILTNAFWQGGFLLAVLWTLFPLALPYLERKQSREMPTEYMREVLEHIAKNTLIFFETAITSEDNALPPTSIQIEPNKGITHHTSPADTGLYLCALLACERMNCLSAQEAAQRIAACVTTLEMLPKWQGLPYQWYDTRTLQALEPEEIFAADCGILAVCLLTCAQGIRVLLPKLDTAHHTLSERLDNLVKGMKLTALYDREAELFYTSVQPETGKSSATHCDLLASESRLLSFAAIMLGQIPSKHWYRLNRTQTVRHTLLSHHGSMVEYLLPLLFQPLVPNTLLETACRRAFRAQKKHRLNHSFGVSDSCCCLLDPDLNYQHRSFGIPELALNPETDSSVLAPYACVLSMAVDLKGSFRNLLKLRTLGLEGSLGLFAAADFAWARTGRKGMQIIRSHLASHQGMILIALCNVLENNYIAELFSSLPRVQAHRLLLEEKNTRTKILVRRPLRHIVRENNDVLLMQRNAVPLSFPIDAHLLSGGGTSLVTDAQGHGYLKNGDVMITRFSQDPAKLCGIRIYLKDSETGSFWTVTDPHLVQQVSFETQQAVFTHEKAGLVCELRIWINPLDGTCLHCLSIENQSKSERIMEVCSYLEPALFNPKENHQQLSMHTERLGTRGLSCMCAAASSSPALYLWHQLYSTVALTLFRVQSDRTAFLGRGRTFLSPRSMHMPISAVPDSIGSFPEICLSARGQFVLPAEGKAVFLFSTLFSKSIEKASSFSDDYAQTDSARRSYDAALTRALVTARYFHLTPKEQADISRLVGIVCWKNPSQVQTAFPVQDQSVLKRLSISDDLPIVLCTCENTIDKSLVTTLLKAHAVHQMSGLFWTLILLIDAPSRTSALVYEAESLVEESRCSIQRNICGGLYILTHQTETDQQILKSISRHVFSCSAGEFSEQLPLASCNAGSRPLYNSKPEAAWQTNLPPSSELVFENSFGGFLTDSGDYQIHLSPTQQTPAPWCNLLCSEHFATLAAETGLLHNRFPGTEAVPLPLEDPITPVGNENFFLRDAEHHLLWSLTKLPLGQRLDVRTTHRPGETIYEGSGYGIESKISCFTDETMGIRHILLKNIGEEARNLTLTHVCTFPAPCELICRNNYLYAVLPDTAGMIALCAADSHEWIVSSMLNAIYQGLWNSIPYALASMEDLPKERGNTALLSIPVRIEPGETAVFTTAVVHVNQYETLEEQMEALHTDGAGKRLHKVRRQWEDHLSLLHFDLPDKALELLLNRWLPYQVQAAMLQMQNDWFKAERPQDLLCLLFTQPRNVRNTLLRFAQYLWEQPDDKAFPVKLRFLYTAAIYLSFTQDVSLANDTAIPVTGQTLLDLFEETAGTYETGAHGLPVDKRSGTESVCAGMMLCEVLRQFAPYTEQEKQNQLLAQRDKLLSSLERYAWDGEWYASGWDERGRPLGSASAKSGSIELETQVWSVLCGLSRERCKKAMDSVWNLLYDRKAGLISCCAPVGNSTGSQFFTMPECCQQTTLACLGAAALHQLGQNGKAWEWIGALMPTNHTASKQLALRYKAEPYVLPEYVQSLEQQAGYAWQTWQPHSASSFWCALVMELLGLRTEGSRLYFRPSVPSSWDDLTITYRYGSATYHLHASRDCMVLHADGTALTEEFLLLTDDGKIHDATFPII